MSFILNQNNENGNHSIPLKKARRRIRKHIPHSKRSAEFVENRNRRERERVKVLNDAFEYLRKCVPLCAHDDRFSKVDILEAATNYIYGLQNMIISHDRQMQIRDTTGYCDQNRNKFVTVTQDKLTDVHTVNLQSRVRIPLRDLHNYNPNTERIPMNTTKKQTNSERHPFHDKTSNWTNGCMGDRLQGNDCLINTSASDHFDTYYQHSSLSNTTSVWDILSENCPFLNNNANTQYSDSISYSIM